MPPPPPAPTPRRWCAAVRPRWPSPRAARRPRWRPCCARGWSRSCPTISRVGPRRPDPCGPPGARTAPRCRRAGRCCSRPSIACMTGGAADAPLPPLCPRRRARANNRSGPGIGHVSLVGAGPGEPDLLTVRAARRLAEADLVLYDALCAREARTLAPEARWFYVGKRAGRESISQEAINRLLVRAARRGFCVVRLKSGDPFVLGRGGEEALALVEAGIPSEGVPGVSSVLAGPGLAGIPLTHRGLAAGFLVVSGHGEAAYG